MEKTMIRPAALSGDLFKPTESNKPAGDETNGAILYPLSTSELLLATHTENLKAMLSWGIFFSMAGSLTYSQDLFRFSPGHIPLFVDIIPASLFAECRQGSDIDPVILSIKLPHNALWKEIPVHMDEAHRIVTSPPTSQSNANVLFFKGALPISVIDAIYLESTTAKKRLMAGQFPNATPKHFSVKVQKRRFHQLKGDRAIHECFTNLSHAHLFSPPKTAAPDHHSMEADARAGVIAILMQTLPPVAESQQLLSYVLTPPPVDYLKLALLPKSLKYINNWIWQNPVKTEDIEAMLLWHLLSLLATFDPHTALKSALFLNELKQQLECSEDLGSAPSIPYSTLKNDIFNRFDQIQEALEQKTDPAVFLTDTTLKSDMMQALFMFLRYQRDLWNLYEDQLTLREWQVSTEAMLFAGIMNGAWQGWHTLDETVRADDKKIVFELSDFMADWMMLHRRNSEKKPLKATSDDSIELNDVLTEKERAPLFGSWKEMSVSGRYTLWEKKILKQTPWRLNSPLGQIARDIAKQRNWPALQTKLSTSQENLRRLSYQREGEVAITLSGDVQIKENMDQTQFLEALETIELTEEEKRRFSTL